MFDITFVGHLCYDEITPYRGESMVTPGSAVLCGALAAARAGKKVAVITRLALRDAALLDPFWRAGVATFVVPADETTFMRVTYPSENVDERILTQVRSAGHFSASEIPDIPTVHLHLAGITDQEFTVDLVEELQARGYTLSCDMQSFVRQVDLRTGGISLRPVPGVETILRHVTKAKFDNVEAEIITGSSRIEEAAAIVEAWGCAEILITQSDRVLARMDQRTYIAPFTHRSTVGRTGRGDTTFAGYLAWRMEHDAAESLRFAAAMASVKMEKAGPFTGTLDDVLNRMAEDALTERR